MIDRDDEPAVLALGGAVTLSSVLEPVADLSRRQSSQFGEVLLLARRRVRVVRVPLSQRRPRLLLEAVRSLLAVPDGARQRELATHAILAHGAQRTAASLLRLRIVSLRRIRIQSVAMYSTMLHRNKTTS